MRAGDLRHRCWLMQPTHTADGMGGITTTYGTATVFWGSVEPLRGREWVQSGLENSEVTGRVRMRWYDGVTPDWRVSFNGRTLQVLSVINPGERDRELELMVRELVVV